MDNSTSKSTSRTPKEQELEYDRLFLKMLCARGTLKKPIVLHVPDDGSNHFSLEEGGYKIEPGDSMIIDIGDPRTPVHRFR